MLMFIYELLMGLILIFGIGFGFFILGFMTGIEYMDLDEDEIRYDKNSGRLARFGAKVIKFMS